MGKFIWHEWARFVSISASVYLVWASIWGILYRKFFFDFIGHTMTQVTEANPVSVPVPNVAYAPILAVIVNIPVIQIVAMIMAITTIAFEYPAPFLKNTFAQRNLTFKMVFLLFQATVAVLFYQGTNAFLWSVIAAGGYARGISLGEVMEVPKEQRGRGGGSRA